MRQHESEKWKGDALPEQVIDAIPDDETSQHYESERLNDDALPDAR